MRAGRFGSNSRGGYTPGGSSANRGDAYHYRGGYNNNRSWQRSSDARGPATPNNHGNFANNNQDSNKRRRTAFDFVKDNKVTSLCDFNARLEQLNSTELASEFEGSCNLPYSSGLRNSILDPHTSKQEFQRTLNEQNQFVGQLITVKLDTQASTSFLPSHLARAAGVCLGATDKSTSASVADGHRLNVYGIYQCPFTLNGHNLKD
eukprot:jgi/Botrbrau1/8085/Bobra.0230s0010.1